MCKLWDPMNGTSVFPGNEIRFALVSENSYDRDSCILRVDAIYDPNKSIVDIIMVYTRSKPYILKGNSPQHESLWWIELDYDYQRIEKEIVSRFSFDMGTSLEAAEHGQLMKTIRLGDPEWRPIRHFNGHIHWEVSPSYTARLDVKTKNSHSPKEPSKFVTVLKNQKRSSSTGGMPKNIALNENHDRKEIGFRQSTPIPTSSSISKNNSKSMSPEEIEKAIENKTGMTIGIIDGSSEPPEEHATKLKCVESNKMDFKKKNMYCFEEEYNIENTTNEKSKENQSQRDDIQDHNPKEEICTYEKFIDIKLKDKKYGGKSKSNQKRGGHKGRNESKAVPASPD